MGKYEQLIADYLNGNLDVSGKNQVEELIANGEISFEDFREMEQLYDDLSTISAPEPGEDVSRKFYSMLDAEIQSQSTKFNYRERFKEFLTGFSFAKVAYTFAILFIGGFFGYQMNDNQNEEIARLSSEMRDMQELMMVSLLQGSSATDRLKAVNISAGLSNPDTEAVKALLFTLNNDASVNVRVQSIEALKRWGSIERVREGLVNSIAQQESPVVIVELADAMIELGLRNSAKEFEQLLKERELDVTVQQKLENSIAVLL